MGRLFLASLETEKSLEALEGMWTRTIQADILSREQTKEKRLIVYHPLMAIDFIHYDRQIKERQIFGVTLDWTIGFHVPSVHYDDAQAIIKTMTVRFLSHDDTPMVLLLEDIGVIARTQGQIIVNPQYWSETELENLPFEYKQENFIG
ncbi:MAG: hypothetical protein AAFR81_24475 [Chloroflexota bacterium]